jgi:hypothetical protein
MQFTVYLVNKGARLTVSVLVELVRKHPHEWQYLSVYQLRISRCAPKATPLEKALNLFTACLLELSSKGMSI